MLPDEFPAVSAAAIACFEKSKTQPLFLAAIDGPGLVDVWLALIPARLRAQYKCNACRAFIIRYGGLVTIDETGQRASVLWRGKPPAEFDDAFKEMARLVESAPVDGVFVTDQRRLGTPSSPPTASGHVWTHFSIQPVQLWTGRTLTADQRAAELRQDFLMISAALPLYSAATIDRAVALLESGTLARPEKARPHAKWLQGLHKATDLSATPLRAAALIWRAVASAPAGFAHISSSVLGTLLDDIQADLPVSKIAARFADKMDPLQYQRPTAAPSDGQIKMAEGIMQKLESAGALRRRWATPFDLKFVWAQLALPAQVSSLQDVPPPAAAPLPFGSGPFVFGHLKGKNKDALPDAMMTWTKFARDVLPKVTSLHVDVPAAGPFVALLAAADPAAPPIFQWDREEGRNTISWYFRHPRPPASAWGLKPGPCRVIGVTLSPTMWGQAPLPNHARQVFFILEGARDMNPSTLAIFPECLRSEYHPIRKTIEEFSKRGKIEGDPSSAAAGIAFQDASGSKPVSIRLIVGTGTTTQTITIDRWD